MEATIVAKDACAWPVLTCLNPNLLGIVHFNRPSHGLLEGSLDALVSRDDGRSWQPAGTPAQAPDGENRMHIASGMDRTGAWIVLSTGFSLVDGNLSQLQSPWCSRHSGDSETWEVNRNPDLDLPLPHPIPHGRIIPLLDGRLAATFYQSEGRGRRSRTCIAFSSDSGRSWGGAAPFGNDDANEAFLLQIDNDSLLAATRTQKDHHVALDRSGDGGKSWVRTHDLTLPMQHPADLIALPDGQLLLTYGIRNRGLMGVGSRISKDGGGTWSPPAVLYQFGEATDCGYPSTVVCANGDLLTACYADHSPLHEGYHLLTIRWRLGEFFDPKPLRSISDGSALEV